MSKRCSEAIVASVDFCSARVAFRKAVRSVAVGVSLSLLSAGAALASTGCTAIQGGALDLPFLAGGPNPAVDRNIAGIAFDAGDVITLTANGVNAPGLGNNQSLTLTVGAVTRDYSRPPNAASTAGVVLTITANGTETSAATHLGTYTSDAAGTIVATCVTAQQAAQNNKNIVKMMQAGQLAAQASGNAISGAISAAVNEAFADTCSAFTPLDNGMRINLNGLTDRDPACFDDNNRTKPSSGFTSEFGDGVNAYAARKRSWERDAFAAFDKKAISTSPTQDWRVWVDVRGTNWSTSGNVADFRGDHVNVLAGLTRRFTRDIVVGIYGGYESFKFTSDSISGRLKGDGGTVGNYLGWRIVDGVRFDASFGYSQIGYDVSANIAPGVFASGNLKGDRWLVTAGLTGDYLWRGFTFEPSARMYWLNEHEQAFTDSTGALQVARTFTTGRASIGNKVIFPASSYGPFALAPYVGLYGDYYFTSDDGIAVLAQNGIATLSLQGISGRAIAGLAAKTTGGTQVQLGGEYGGIGGNVHVWTYRARVGVPF